MHSVYCDRCGVESKPGEEPYEESTILPGPPTRISWPDRQLVEGFVHLDEHHEMTGDRYWCMSCWNEVTEPEVSRVWENCFSGIQTRVDPPRYRYLWQESAWALDRCTSCSQWLLVPNQGPVIETTRYTVLLDVAGDPIDGWVFGAYFRRGLRVEVRCPEHAPREEADRLLDQSIREIEEDLQNYRLRRRKRAA